MGEGEGGRGEEIPHSEPVGPSRMLLLLFQGVEGEIYAVNTGTPESSCLFNCSKINGSINIYEDAVGHQLEVRGPHPACKIPIPSD